MLHSSGKLASFLFLWSLQDFTAREKAQKENQTSTDLWQNTNSPHYTVLHAEASRLPCTVVHVCVLCNGNLPLGSTYFHRSYVRFRMSLLVSVSKQRSLKACICK